MCSFCFHPKFCVVAVLSVAVGLANATTFAVLGESEQELRQRYGVGEPFDVEGTKWADKAIYFWKALPGPNGGEISVVACIVGDKCVAETYIFKNAAGKPAVIDGDVYDAAKNIVEENSQGHTWGGRPGLPPRGIAIVWVRSDDPGTTAVVWEQSPHLLEVFSAEANAVMESRLSGTGAR